MFHKILDVFGTKHGHQNFTKKYRKLATTPLSKKISNKTGKEPGHSVLAILL